MLVWLKFRLYVLLMDQMTTYIGSGDVLAANKRHWSQLVVLIIYRGQRKTFVGHHSVSHASQLSHFWDSR